MTSRDATRDESIKVGDLVQVVRPWPCCGQNAASIGQIFVVQEITKDRGTCGVCRARAGVVAFKGPHNGCPVSRLKRIPPPEELGIVDEKEDIREPA